MTNKKANSEELEVKVAFLEDALSTLSDEHYSCLLYTSPSPRDLSTSRMPSSA